jgi:hypothetical protein
MAKSKYETFAEDVDSVAKLKLVYDDGDLRVQGLDHSDSLVVELRFRDVLTTRISYEGVRLRLLRELKSRGGFVLKVKQSELIEWVHDEGLQTRDLTHAEHFFVFVGEEVVEVVALSDPEISIS